MPNAKGGKGYKKGKHDDDEVELLECVKMQNQMYGRTMKSLGNRRFRIFCNDGKERICRVCGSMRKSQWVEQGSLVLISIRDLSMSTVPVPGKEEVYIGDIIGLIDPRVIGKMKKLEGINPLLFTAVETKDPSLIPKGLDEDFFARDCDDEENDERKEIKKVREIEISTARNTKYNDEDINIDDI